MKEESAGLHVVAREVSAQAVPVPFPRAAPEHYTTNSPPMGHSSRNGRGVMLVTVSRCEAFLQRECSRLKFMREC